MKRRRGLIWVITAGAICALAMLCPHRALAAEQHDVIFYEVMWSGTLGSSSDEWIVLYNNTINDIDLTNWNLSKVKPCGSDTFVDNDLSGIIGAKDFYIIASKTSNDSALADSVIVDYQKSLQLCNDGLKLNLFDDNNILIDTADDGDGAPMAGYNGDNYKASMQRNFPVEDGSLATSWHNCQAQANLDAGVQDLATPKAIAPIIDDRDWPDYLVIGKKAIGELDIGPVLEELGLQIQIDRSVWQNIDAGIVEIQILCKLNGNNSYQIDVRDKYYALASITKQTYCFDDSQIFINEVMPNPSVDYNKDGEIDNKSDEWIELYNSNKSDIDLQSFKICDRASYSNGKCYIFSESNIIKRNNYLLLYRGQTNLSLNNDSEDLYLLNPVGDIIARASWVKAPGGSALMLKNDGKYQWTLTPTPGKANVLTLPPSQNRPANVKRIPTGDVQNNIGQWVEIEGTVIEQSGSTIYIDDGSGRVKVYIQEKTGIQKPSIHKGDVIRVIGFIDVYNSVVRLLPQWQSDIGIIAKYQKAVVVETKAVKKTKTTTVKRNTIKNAIRGPTAAGMQKLNKIDTSILDNNNPAGPTPLWIIPIIAGCSVLIIARYMLLLVV